MRSSNAISAVRFRREEHDFWVRRRKMEWKTRKMESSESDGAASQCTLHERTEIMRVRTTFGEESEGGEEGERGGCVSVSEWERETVDK